MKALIIVLMILLSGCATKPVELGDKVPPPIGYVLHCWDFPDSIFCEPVMVK